jgi:hypothetical protein
MKVKTTNLNPFLNHHSRMLHIIISVVNRVEFFLMKHKIKFQSMKIELRNILR